MIGAKAHVEPSQYNAVVEARHGTMLFNRHDIYVGRSIQKYGEYSELELEFLLAGIKDGDTVVEVGANIGSHTIALARKTGSTGRVIAFEPQRIVFQTLCANLALSSISNAYCFHCALSDVEEELLVPPMDYARPANFGGLSLTKAGLGESVAARQLDSIGRLTRLKLIKIDVEGMESAVIRGATATIKSHRPALYVENDRVDKSAELIELIRSLDYRMYWHRPPLFNPGNYFGEKENIFPNLISVNMLCLHKSQETVEGLQEVTDTAYHPLAKPGK
jgi:FkbM family methyltransferase